MKTVKHCEKLLKYVSKYKKYMKNILWSTISVVVSSNLNEYGIFFKSSFSRSLKYGTIANWIEYFIFFIEFIAFSNLWIWKHQTKSFSFAISRLKRPICIYTLQSLQKSSKNWILVSNSTTLPFIFEMLTLSCIML